MLLLSIYDAQICKNLDNIKLKKILRSTTSWSYMKQKLPRIKYPTLFSTWLTLQYNLNVLKIKCTGGVWKVEL